MLLPSTAMASDNDINIQFNKGLQGSTEDGNFKFKFGGRIMWDTAYYSADSGLEAALGSTFEDGSEFRRSRLYISGTIYKNVIFEAQYDFAGGDADFKDVYVGIKGLPFIGTLKAGHFKEPFSLENLTSSKYISLMERNANNDVFVHGRNSGLGFQNTMADERGTYAFGVFKDAGAFGDSVCDNRNFTGRVTGLPWKGENGDLLHVGAGASLRKPCSDTVSFSARPESYLAEKVLSTGSITSDDYEIYNVELALVFGPASLQGEYFLTELDTGGASDPDLHGHYVEATWWLTGESRKYNKSAGAFSRTSPNNNFAPDGAGWGGWQLAARYTGVDLSDIAGQELKVLTFGVNWHLNPNARVMVNYGWGDRDDLADGEVDIFQTRVQIDF